VRTNTCPVFLSAKTGALVGYRRVEDLVAQRHASLFLVEWACPANGVARGGWPIGAYYFCRKRYAHSRMAALADADQYLSDFFDPHDTAS
jgi:hypothetical protein